MLLQYNIAFYIPNQGPHVSLDYPMQKGAKWNTNVPKLWKEGDITIPTPAPSDCIHHSAKILQASSMGALQFYE